MTCDNCNAQVISGNKISSSDFKILVSKGFGIDEENIKMLTEIGMSKEDAIKNLAASYFQSESDWLLCNDCFTKASTLLY